MQFVGGFCTQFRAEGTLSNGILVMIGFACPDKEQICDHGSRWVKAL